MKRPDDRVGAGPISLRPCQVDRQADEQAAEGRQGEDQQRVGGPQHAALGRSRDAAEAVFLRRVHELGEG